MTLFLFIISAAAIAIAVLAIKLNIGQARKIGDLAAALAAARRAAQATAEQIRIMQEERNALQADLARLRAGSPGDRVAASLDVLRDAAANTGCAPRGTGALAPGLADLGAAARGRDPRR